MEKLKALIDNPNRILGIVSNASLRDKTSMRNRMNAFLRVGRKMACPLDMADLLGEVDRTQESVEHADSLLTIEKDKLSAAQFWFIYSQPIDGQGFDLIAKNDISAALQLWAGHASMSACQNSTVAYLALDDLKNACLNASHLYSRFSAEFMAALDLPASSYTRQQLIKDFVGVVLREAPDTDASLLISTSYDALWNNAAKDGIVNPIIKKLTDLVAMSRASKDKDRNARLAAGQTLATEAIDLIAKLQLMVPQDDTQFVIISDKVGNEVLQSGIDYYNAMPEPQFATKALEMVNLAKKFVKGSVLKGRIKENEEILKGILYTQEPKEEKPSPDIDAINAALALVSTMPHTLTTAQTIINDSREPLKMLAQNAGTDDDTYVHYSSLIVDTALSIIIEAVNAKQKAFNDAEVGSQEEADAKNAYIFAVNTAWRYTEQLKNYVMKPSTKDRFITNQNILENLTKQCNASHRSYVVTKEDDGGDTFVSCLWQIFVYVLLIMLVAMVRNC